MTRAGREEAVCDEEPSAHNEELPDPASLPLLRPQHAFGPLLSHINGGGYGKESELM